MTEDALSDVIRLAARFAADCVLLHAGREVIVVGMDRARGVALLKDGGEVPVRELAEPLA
jgi:hypothetical protein